MNNFTLSNTPNSVNSMNAQQFQLAAGEMVDKVKMFIDRDYMEDCGSLPVYNLRKEFCDFSQIRLIKLNKIILSPEENVNSKLVNIFRAMYNLSSSCVVIINCKNGHTDYYMGIRSLSHALNAEDAFRSSLSGNFPGCEYTSLNNSQIESLLTSSINSNSASNSVAAVSIVPSERDGNKEYVQGIERFVDSMAGNDYTAVFIAAPVSGTALASRRSALEQLHSDISALETLSSQMGQNSSVTTSISTTNTITDSINHSIADSVGSFSSSGTSRNTGINSGNAVNLLGITFSHGKGHGSSTMINSGSNQGNTVTTGTAKGTSVATGQNNGTTDGTTRSVTLSMKNKTVTELLKKIDSQLDRIRNCESYGMWECAGYFISSSPNVARIAASNYSALVSGTRSNSENSHLNIWSPKENKVGTYGVLKNLEYCAHPIISLNQSGSSMNVFFNHTSFVSGNELPIMLGVPYRSIDGVSVMRMAEFGRSVQLANTAVSSAQNTPLKEIPLGHVYHMGKVESTKVSLSSEAMRGHCFITGTNNSGKSNATFLSLNGLYNIGCKFLVIEPVKGEYKKIFGRLPGVKIFTALPNSYRMLKINPFRFCSGTTVREHIDRLVDIFNVCWPMYTTMPALLRECVEKAYIKRGWDLTNSINVFGTPNNFPDFSDMLELMPKIIEKSQYVGETKGNFMGSMITRLKTLSSGTYGMIFSGKGDLSDRELFDENVIIDLSHMGGSETKSLIIGMLIIRLYEYRAASIKQENAPLHHVTVLEEAHNIFMRVSTDQHEDSSNVKGKSVELLKNILAEIRSYGEGFMIVDQSPTEVHSGAIKNTNTKIIMKLPEQVDRETAAGAIGADNFQADEIARLPIGVAAVFQTNWIQPILVKVDKWQSNLYRADERFLSYDSIRMARGELTREIIRQFRAGKYDRTPLNNIILGLKTIDNDKKADYIAIFNAFEQYYRDIKQSFDRLSTTRREFFAAMIVELLGAYEFLEIVGLPAKDAKITKDLGKNPEFIRNTNGWYSFAASTLSRYVNIDDSYKKNIISLILVYNRASDPRIPAVFNIINNLN